MQLVPGQGLDGWMAGMAGWDHREGFLFFFDCGSIGWCGFWLEQGVFDWWGGAWRLAPFFLLFFAFWG